MEKTFIRLDQIIDDRSREQPDKIAIKYRSKKYSYASVNDISGRLALYLKARHVKRGDIVGVALNRSAELAIVLLAIVKAGATYLPIDVKLPQKRINYMLEDAGAKFLFSSKVLDIANKTNCKAVYIEDAWEQCKKYEPADLKFQANADDIAFVLYTSGSTGHPKGVQVKHSGLLNLLLSIQQSPGADSNDILLATTTISFDIATLEIFLPLISGATLVMADADTAKDGRLLLDIALAENITIMQGTPTMWANMLDSDWAEPLKLKVFCGGEAMSKDLAKKLLPKCNELWNMYGPTETTIYSIIKNITAKDKIITIGKPVLNTQVYILDEHQNKVADGETGEIYIAGMGVALGYINNPELTAQKFINDKFSSFGKMYNTGDVGRSTTTGDIEYLGRLDHQIKIRGYRIETEEIEYQLRQLGDIKDALVVLFTDFLGNNHLAAYIVTKGGNEETLATMQAAWKASLKKILPDYMVPDVYKIIPAIPRLVNGKTDRQALPPFVIGEGVTDEFEGAGTATEQLLTAICLKFIAIDKIGINDNFFDLGLDSMVALQIMVQIEHQLFKRLPLSTLIKYPTIKQLASFLDADMPDSLYKCLVPIKPEGNKTPLYIIHGIGLNLLNVYSMVSNLDAEQPVYGLQPLGLDGTMEPLDDLEEIASFYINEIINHNPLGPYAIAGYSFGGYIAFEMAKQFKAMGKDLVMLGMFDSNIQTSLAHFKIFQKIKIKLLRQFNKIVFRAGTLRRYPLLTMKYLAAYFRHKVRVMLKGVGVPTEDNPDQLPGFMIKIVNKLEAAFNKYELEPIDAEIDLFKAKMRIYYIDDPEYLGWQKYALKGVRVYNVPGDHKNMFSKPNDKTLAMILQGRLNHINNKIAKETLKEQ